MDRKHKTAITLWAFLWLIWIALIILPESRGLFRLRFILLTAHQLIAGLILFWKYPRIRYIFIAYTTAILITLLLPGRSPNPDQLRTQYIQAFQTYEGITYSWGGENRFGIDCSGLVRKGFISGNITQGLKTLNGTQIRHGLSLWCTTPPP